MIYEDVRRPRAEQLSFVLHLGDFIYEVVRYPEDSPDGMDRGRKLTGAVRYPKGEKAKGFHFPVDLEDYRTAYRSFLLDPDLQDARARWPFVPVWDNHEFSWNGYQSQQVISSDPPRPAQALKVAASQAWYEYRGAVIRKARRCISGPHVEKPALGIDARGWGGAEQSRRHSCPAHRARLPVRQEHRHDLTDNRSFRQLPSTTQTCRGSVSACSRKPPTTSKQGASTGRGAGHAAHRRDRNSQPATQ
jgi:alkaline phosphatase D